ncbi:MAG: hypothetical protein GPJ52_00850 [Candidatus Heimdallarchaeota archaeon]|nr:hypothetical protein [Candidatus Heimdallarchaeota archaeon]
MTSKRITIITVGISILILSSVSVTLFFIRRELPLNTNNNDFEQIIITKNSDFSEKYHFQGNGTLQSPYLIEYLTIETKLEIAIGIYDVSCIFTIQHCKITARRFCIYLSNVTEPGCKIRNNLCSIDTIGVYGPEGVAIEIYKSIGIMVSNNYCHTVYYYRRNVGIQLNKTDFSTVSNNTCTNFDQGISQTIMTGNWGVFEEFTPINNTIKGNNCIDNKLGISVISAGWLELIDNLCANNSEGMRVHFVRQYANQSTKISNNTVIFNFKGMTIWVLPSADISGNNCSYNYYYGISLSSCFGNITRNTCQGNKNGLEFGQGSCFVYFNNFINNDEYGIKTYTIYEKFIFSNNFINNNLEGTETGSAQAYDKDSIYPDACIKWFNPTTLEGNYWSDLFWDDIVVYELDASNNIDPYPLRFPIDI